MYNSVVELRAIMIRMAFWGLISTMVVYMDPLGKAPGEGHEHEQFAELSLSPWVSYQGPGFYRSFSSALDPIIVARPEDSKYTKGTYLSVQTVRAFGYLESSGYGITVS